MGYKVQKSDEEWREQLNPQQYSVLRQAATERPFTGEYVYTDTEGSYHCAGCGQLLFTSTTKFDAGCGWPSFWEQAIEGSIEERPDYSHNRVRTEVLCSNCGSHLGHVFEDGPRETTGLRYCINSVALTFTPKADADSE